MNEILSDQVMNPDELPYLFRHSYVHKYGNSDSGRFFYEFERECEKRFKENGPYFHICSPENFMSIFLDDSDFKQGVTKLAVAASSCSVRIIAFELMNNHVHLILAGQEQECVRLFETYRSKLARMTKAKGIEAPFNLMIPNVIPINDVRMLRTEIAYVHRNCIIPDPERSPFSYLWGTGFIYFNELIYLFPQENYCSLTLREKRELLHSRHVDLPAYFSIMNGMISPLTFCSIDEGQMYFRNAMSYFLALFNDYESYSRIAKRDNDSAIVSYDEFFYAACSVCKTDFGVSFPNRLSNEDKIKLARRMHDDFHATNAQLNRVLGIDRSVLNELFPMPLKRK